MLKRLNNYILNSIKVAILGFLWYGLFQFPWKSLVNAPIGGKIFVGIMAWAWWSFMVMIVSVSWTKEGEYHKRKLTMFKFNHIDMEKEDNPVLWDRISKDDFDLIMRCKNLYEQCIAYTGRNIHEVCGCAGNLLNGTDHFLYSFTEKFINKKHDIDGLNATYAADGGWEGHTRKFLVEQVIPRALKALNE